ncbi:MAG: hypothetical protein ACD_72C00026G0003, partial [uncultured bacterium]
MIFLTGHTFHYTMSTIKGPLAQLARALPWHGRG